MNWEEKGKGFLNVEKRFSAFRYYGVADFVSWKMGWKPFLFMFKNAINGHFDVCVMRNGLFNKYIIDYKYLVKYWKPKLLPLNY